MKFFIIENKRAELNILLATLARCHSDAELQTEAQETIDRWSDASKQLAAKTVDSADQVIFCDLALDDDGAPDANAGLARVQELISIRPNATWIAYTSFTEVLGLNAATQIFHAILSKQEMSQHRSAEARAAFVSQTIRRANSNRRGASPVLHDVEDSLGMRVFYASFSTAALEEFLNTECPRWTSISVRALSAGYSGSSLLSVGGIKDGGVRSSIVVKIAPRASLIERETKVLDDEVYKGELADFAKMCARGRPIKALSAGLGYYSIQETIPGPTLGSFLRSARGQMMDEAQLGGVNIVIAVQLVQCSKGRVLNVDDGEHKRNRLGLSAIDLHRAKKSCEQLGEMAALIARQNGWPQGAPSPAEVFERVHYVTSNWERLLLEQPAFLWVIQHGDLNPENVILGDAQQITFIDLARLDRWPVGYDLARLSLQMRIRLTHTIAGEDWINNRLSTWYAESMMTLDGATDHFLSCCPAASYCERELARWIEKQPEADVIRNGVLICSLLDLTRIVSYSDLSPFKRLWAALTFWQISERLGFGK